MKTFKEFVEEQTLLEPKPKQEPLLEADPTTEVQKTRDRHRQEIAAMKKRHANEIFAAQRRDAAKKDTKNLKTKQDKITKLDKKKK